jgi:hypothetical protein
VLMRPGARLLRWQGPGCHEANAPLLNYDISIFIVE